MNLENLLQPIPGDHPCGKDPRRSMIFDEISRLRKPGELEELDREDWTKIRDLSLEVLTSQSKDLQLSVWLLEALGRLEGIDGLRDGLELTKNLIETFWKDVFPEIDEEDEEPLYRRTAVVESLNLIIPDIVKIEPLTLSGEGYSMLHYEVTQMTGEKKEALLNDGWPSSARFDEEMMRASLDHWKGMEEKCSALVEELAHLEEVTDKFFSAVDSDKSSSGSLESTVSFLKSKEVLEEFLYLVKRNARKKAELEPPVEQPVHETPEVVESESNSTEVESTAAVDDQSPPVQQPEPPRVEGTASGTTTASVIPTSEEDAFEKVFLLADFLRSDNPYRPIPYLLTRAVAWGHLFGLASVGSGSFPAPSSELRARLRELTEAERWTELLDESEQALSRPENRAWLDLHRYVLMAMENLGENYSRAALAISGLLEAVLKEHPALAEAEHADGTSLASNETQRWLEVSFVRSDEGNANSVVEVPTIEARVVSADSAVSALTEAMELVGRRQVGKALNLLQTRVANAGSGRERFMAKLELAEVCLEAGQESLSYPLLEDLVSIIDQFSLESWEEKSIVIRAWSAMVRCCQKMGRSLPDGKEKAKHFHSRICRLDVTAAMSIRL